MIRNTAERAEITAVFDCEKHADVQLWLQENSLESDSVVLRRVLVRDGKSRAYINPPSVILIRIPFIFQLQTSLPGVRKISGNLPNQ